MFQNFDPKERKAILIILVALLGGAIFFSGGESFFAPEDPFHHRSERFGSPMESERRVNDQGSYESYF